MAHLRLIVISCACFDHYRVGSAEVARRVLCSRAKPFSDEVVEIVLASSGRDQTLKMVVLRDTGLTSKAAKRLVDSIRDPTNDQAGAAFIALLEFPAMLRALHEQRPELVKSLDEQSHQLFRYLCKHQSEPNETRELLSTLDNLPPSIMAMLREPKFVPMIQSLVQDASVHHRTFLVACKRDCGDLPDNTIIIDSDHPVEFRPKSAWPNTDNRRLSPTSAGHGDGTTHVMVTGELKMSDGSHPKSVQFFGVNDQMLLGTRRNDPEPVLYQPASGRFVFYTSVFAAYSMGKDQPEPGPYQTGSAQVRIEAPNCEPITVQFFDEMPDVSIRLSQKNP